MNWKIASSMTRIIEEESLSEMKQGEAIEEQHGDLTLKFHEASTTWKILSSIMTANRAQEGVLRQEEGEGEEHPRRFRFTIQEIRTSTTDTIEEAIALKRARNQREHSKN
jgi:hypothetical protein